jgi:hypothetical protein
MLWTMRAGYDRATREGNGLVLKRQAYKLPRQRLSTMPHSVAAHAVVRLVPPYGLCRKHRSWWNSIVGHVRAVIPFSLATCPRP